MKTVCGHPYSLFIGKARKLQNENGGDQRGKCSCGCIYTGFVPCGQKNMRKTFAHDLGFRQRSDGVKFHTNGGEKFDYSKGNVTDIPLMRVEEMYLIEAEATAHYDAAAGKQLLNSFMATRAKGYVYNGSDVVEETIFQKRVELWGEGVVLYDMKRMNIGWNNANNSNSPVYNRISTNGRAPWWNLTLPENAEQMNAALKGFNNPNPCITYISND